MRIVQLSDIHLSKENLEDLQNYYLQALLEDITRYHEQIPVDLVLFTGDLVDKGGNSLGTEPYKIFSEEVIQPIMGAIGINSNQVLLLPGNHDIDRAQIEKFNEAGLLGTLDSSSANELMGKMDSEFTAANKRLERFKSFEQQFHKYNREYIYSNNSSAAIFEYEGKKIGIALINDSWRCSGYLPREKHFIGFNQLLKTEKLFAKHNTILNIAAFHHPLTAINENESEEIENILKSKKYDVAFFGHSHKHEAHSLVSATGGYLTINGRAAFNNPEEKIAKFLPGYNIFDVDPEKRTYTLYARLFVRENGYRFDSDTTVLPGGQESGILPNLPTYVELAVSENSKNNDQELPNSYSADVHRIVKLLIGKSLYPDNYSFVRELIQNAVDACHRLTKRKTHLTPKIIININTTENFFEVIDQGDGMTKDILKNHFSVIGKSISQEFNDSTGNFNLISQFGIGFMSTFIVAEKVLVITKSDVEEQIAFEINDVFKEFNYLNVPPESRMTISGTTIRVYFKKGFQLDIALSHVRSYCRHIDNLEILYDSNQIPLNQSWHTEGGSHYFDSETESFKVKLCISSNPRTFFASNSGFLITTSPHPLIPFRFPALIGGEVNFFPKGIDFDMSRTNIMTSEKSLSFRRNISVSLRKLFRESLEAGEANLIEAVVQYLHYYLQNFETDNSQMQLSYTDFYSKKELVTLCCNHTFFFYQGISSSISSIISSCKANGIIQMFYINGSIANDYQTILIEFLENKGYLVIRNRTVNVAFSDATIPTTLLNVMQIIASEHNMSVLQISEANQDVIKDMKMEKNLFRRSIQEQIAQIESSHEVTVEIGKFSNLPKASVRNGNQIFLNFDHETFQSLLKSEDIPENILNIYLMGILGLQLVQ